MMSKTTIIIIFLITIIQKVTSHTYAVHDHPSHPYFREETDSEKKARMRRLNTFIPYVIIYFSQIQHSFKYTPTFTLHIHISPLSLSPHLLTHTLTTQRRIETRYTDPTLASSVGRLRVKFVWDLVDDLLENPDESDTSKMKDPALCRAAGDTVDPCRFERSGSGCSSSCQSYVVFK